MNAKVSLTTLYQAKIHKFDEYDLEDFKDPGRSIASLTLSPRFLIS